MSDFIFLRRTSLVALGVVSSHAALILALNSNLRTPARELLVPVSLLSQPAAVPAPAVPAALRKGVTPPAPAPVQPASPQSATSPDQLSPATLAAAGANKSASSPSPALAASPPVSSWLAAPVASASAVAGTAASSAVFVPNIELPSSDADYLRNPRPIYPELSKRLNEQGTVIHGVFIGADGRPMSARLVQSSGFDRLDKAAYEAVMQWRYVPGKRQGVPEAMTFNVPVKWALE